MYTSNDIFFPHHIIPSLKHLRGPKWHDLVCEISSCTECDTRTIAFMLMMARLNGCVSCETDSYRAMRGCSLCTQQTLRRYKGTDEDLIGLYKNALDDVKQFTERDHPLVDFIR
ncbi:MAG: hypothetical protein AAFV33_12875 [Chloroflexota bacterium]